MAEIVNLRRARKRKAREAAAAEAGANRILHGAPKHARNSAKALSAKEKHDLDSRRLDRKAPN
jgi:hypothetical protein